MSELNGLLKKSDINRYEKFNLSQLYQELNKALRLNKVQLTWTLSKIITRVHFKTFDT